MMNDKCNVRVPSTSYCVAGGARAPAHAEPELARQEHAHAPPFCDARLLLIVRVGIIRRVLEILAIVRARFDHDSLSVALHRPDVQQVGSTPPAPDGFNIFRRNAPVEEGGGSPNPI